MAPLQTPVKKSLLDGLTHQSKQRVRQLVQKTAGPSNPGVCCFINTQIIQPNMMFTQQQLHAAFSPAAPSEPYTNEETRLPTVVSPAHVIDFFDTRDRLPAEFQGTAKESKTEREIHRTAALRERSAGLIDALEESLYWLITISTLAYLIFGV